jgi:hypothetical protein
MICCPSLQIYIPEHTATSSQTFAPCACLASAAVPCEGRSQPREVPRPRSLQPGPPQYYRAAALRSGASTQSSAVRSSAARFLEGPCGLRPGGVGDGPQRAFQKITVPTHISQICAPYCHLASAVVRCEGRSQPREVPCKAASKAPAGPSPSANAVVHPPIRQ